MDFVCIAHNSFDNDAIETRPVSAAKPEFVTFMSIRNVSALRALTSVKEIQTRGTPFGDTSRLEFCHGTPVLE
jgi:hypothetical protein